MPMHRELYRGIRFGKHLNVSVTCARDAGDVEGWRLGVFCRHLSKKDDTYRSGVEMMGEEGTE